MHTEEQTPNVQPEVVFISELLQGMNQGRYRVPRFQRDFIWRPEQMRQFLDSIRKRYPVGNILVWESERRMGSLGRIGPHEVKPAPKGGLVNYILDGQQRLSTLYGTLIRPANEDVQWKWRVWYNLDSNEFVHFRKGETPGPEHFPMSELLNTFQFLQACGKISKQLENDERRAQELIEHAQDLAERFRNYKLPVVRIRDAGLVEAVNIFARLNSTGTRISEDEMASALCYEEESEEKPHFHLATRILDLQARLEEQNFGTIPRIFLLRAILAALDEEDLYRNNWVTLLERKGSGEDDGRSKRKRLPDAIEAVESAIAPALEFLAEQRVCRVTALPYTMQLVFLLECFRRCPEPSPEVRNILTRWFWVSSFTGWFAFGNSSRIRQALLEMRALVDGEREALSHIDLDGPAQPLPGSFDLRSARIRTLILFLISLEPRDLQTGDILNVQGIFADKDYRSLAHVIPFRSPRPDCASSPANRILLPVGANRQLKKSLCSLPEVYENGVRRETVLLSHGINEAAYEHLLNGGDEAFVAAREEYLRQAEVCFMKSHAVAPPKDFDTNDASFLDTGEELDLEESL